MHKRQKLESDLLWRTLFIYAQEIKVVLVSVQDLCRVRIHETLIDLHCVVLAVGEEVKERLQAPIPLRLSPFRPKRIMLNPIVRLEEKVDSRLDCRRDEFRKGKERLEGEPGLC